MGILANIFTWWNGATFGTWLFTARKGTKVGEDHQGNVYYEGGVDPNGLTRRWVMYNGANDASRVPAEWHGWLHHSIEGTPESFLPPPRIWEKEFTPNATGTANAYRPSGALEKGGQRQKATGDYEAWSPDAA
ncbi:MAG: NADH:ubiquinone oxidoreductase subunit NDUFA12 [Sphingobium yanoikuyae]|nr:NADH:ubiquinone oxidoreductase subunit NDUFA12 [Sphingobium yanoikuyae]